MRFQLPFTVGASGFNALFTDPNTGAVYTQGWIQIRYIIYTPNTSCQVVTDVYFNENVYQSGTVEPVSFSIMPVVNYGTDDWNSYFDLSILQQKNSDIQTESLNYLQAKLGPNP